MKAPEIPHDEAYRLQTLRALDVLDTPAEERFDRLTRMAKRIFRVPIALVSLIDENRQWFKSCDGLGAAETPRGISFCGHAILGDDIFVIPDATQDGRFADNPLVLGAPHIRFYAGCPLRAFNGQKLGTLCIIDQQPRSFDPDDAQTLRDLAAMVEAELAAFQLATLDELTRILNRRGFMLLAQHSLNTCARQGDPAALAFIDLDKFKPINDAFGHAEGDFALTVCADLLKRSFRNSDLFARLGGDEFVVLLTHTSRESAEGVMAKFAQAVEAHNREVDRGYDIAFSCGIVSFDPARHTSIEALLAEGDALMYEVKLAKNLGGSSA
jgi:diguanylate cyclase (GGDEF)-like protein